jgi:hypothetical protein
MKSLKAYWSNVETLTISTLRNDCEGIYEQSVFIRIRIRVRYMDRLQSPLSRLLSEKYDPIAWTPGVRVHPARRGF